MTAALASGQARFETAFAPFLMKHLYRCDSVVIASFVGTGCVPRGDEDDCWTTEEIGCNIKTECLVMDHKG